MSVAARLLNVQAYGTANAFGGHIPFKVSMRAAPTASFSNVADIGVFNSGASPAAATGTPLFITTTDYCTLNDIQRTGAGLTAGDAVVIGAISGSPTMIFDARL